MLVELRWWLTGSYLSRLAGLAMRVLSAIWSGYAIWRTFDIEKRFKVLITDGACGVDLFPGYFKDRMIAQIVDVVLNIVALCLSLFLVWRLVKVSTAYYTKNMQIINSFQHWVNRYTTRRHSVASALLPKCIRCIRYTVFFVWSIHTLITDCLWSSPSLLFLHVFKWRSIF